MLTSFLTESPRNKRNSKILSRRCLRMKKSSFISRTNSPKMKLILRKWKRKLIVLQNTSQSWKCSCLKSRTRLNWMRRSYSRNHSRISTPISSHCSISPNRSRYEIIGLFLEMKEVFSFRWLSWCCFLDICIRRHKELSIKRGGIHKRIGERKGLIRKGMSCYEGWSSDYQEILRLFIGEGVKLLSWNP